MRVDTLRCLLKTPVIWLASIAIAALLSCASGCQSQSSTTNEREKLHADDVPRQPKPEEPITVGPGPTNPQDAAFPTDDSVGRFEQINAALFLYYASNKALPDSLQDLQSVANLALTSPRSGQPYVYIRQGLQSNSSNRSIIVYDPSAVVDSAGVTRRPCIRLSPLQPGRGLSSEVLLLPEPVFQSYHPDGR